MHHSFRSTDATILPLNGATNNQIIKAYGWASTAVAQQCVQQSDHEKEVRVRTLKKKNKLIVSKQKGEVLSGMGSNVQPVKLDFGNAKIGTLIIYSHFEGIEAKETTHRK
eukprot:snap_masked-scaffold_37-processed-gene-0.22-mRNA-1 protein AED:1.00 eAED:1.00 QI:0/0/0/0/1/1/2/0/109